MSLSAKRKNKPVTVNRPLKKTKIDHSGKVEDSKKWALIPGTSIFSISSDLEIRNDKSGKIFEFKKNWNSITLKASDGKEKDFFVTQLAIDVHGQQSCRNWLRKRYGLQDEEWKIIPGCPEHLISSLGTIFSASAIRILKTSKSFFLINKTYINVGQILFKLWGYEFSNAFWIKKKRFTADDLEWRVIPEAPNHYLSSSGLIKRMDLVTEKESLYENQEWKTIEHCPNYEVSNYGKIRRFQSTKVRKLSNIDGYLNVGIDGNNFRVHRLVAEAFIPNSRPDVAIYVDHINEQKTCNEVWNLRWCTQSENMIYSHGKIVEKIDPITGAVLQTFRTVKFAAESLGFEKIPGAFYRSLKSDCSIRCCDFFWKYKQMSDDERREALPI